MYFESILVSSYGYFSIVPNAPVTVDDAPTNGLPGGRVPTTYINLDAITMSGNNNIYVEYKAVFEKIRNALSTWLNAFDVDYNLLYSFGFYSWVLLFLIIIVFSVKKSLVYIIPFLLGVLMVLVCCFSSE